MHQTGAAVTKQRLEKVPHPLPANIFILAVRRRAKPHSKPEDMTRPTTSPREVTAAQKD